MEPYRPEVFARAAQEHADLVAAVVAGDVERAGRAARAHFGMSAEALRETLARGLADSPSEATMSDGPSEATMSDGSRCGVAGTGSRR